jgi:hypothetical protein
MWLTQTRAQHAKCRRPFELGTASYRADLRCGLQLLSISWAASLLLSVGHTTVCGRSATTRQSRVSEVDLMSAMIRSASINPAGRCRVCQHDRETRLWQPAKQLASASPPRLGDRAPPPQNTNHSRPAGSWFTSAESISARKSAKSGLSRYFVRRRSMVCRV